MAHGQGGSPEAECCAPAYVQGVQTAPQVDKEGACCSTAVDACGVCGGTGFAMLDGVCCEVRMINDRFAHTHWSVMIDGRLDCLEVAPLLRLHVASH
jgi:hypothetical protein